MESVVAWVRPCFGDRWIHLAAPLSPFSPSKSISKGQRRPHCRRRQPTFPRRPIPVEEKRFFFRIFWKSIDFKFRHPPAADAIAVHRQIGRPSHLRPANGPEKFAKSRPPQVRQPYHIWDHLQKHLSMLYNIILGGFCVGCTARPQSHTFQSRRDESIAVIRAERHLAWFHMFTSMKLHFVVPAWVSFEHWFSIFSATLWISNQVSNLSIFQFPLIKKTKYICSNALNLDPFSALAFSMVDISSKMWWVVDWLCFLGLFTAATFKRLRLACQPSHAAHNNFSYSNLSPGFQVTVCRWSSGCPTIFVWKKPVLADLIPIEFFHCSWSWFNPVKRLWNRVLLRLCFLFPVHFIPFSYKRPGLNTSFDFWAFSEFFFLFTVQLVVAERQHAVAERFAQPGGGRNGRLLPGTPRRLAARRRHRTPVQPWTWATSFFLFFFHFSFFHWGKISRSSDPSRNASILL